MRLNEAGFNSLSALKTKSIAVFVKCDRHIILCHHLISKKNDYTIIWRYEDNCFYDKQTC